MGLGKIIQLLAFLEDRRQRGISKGPTLVVVPRSLIFNWHQEATRFTPGLKVLEYTGIQRGQLRRKLARADLVLTTYDTIRRDILQLKEVEFDYIVLDEAQAIKNPAAKQSQAARDLGRPGKKGRFRIALTGTPVENRVSELWALMDFLNPKVLGDEPFFRQRYRLPIERSFKVTYTRGAGAIGSEFKLPTLVAGVDAKLESRFYDDLDIITVLAAVEIVLRQEGYTSFTPGAGVGAASAILADGFVAAKKA